MQLWSRGLPTPVLHDQYHFAPWLVSCEPHKVEPFGKVLPGF
ncbi:unnamed protein product, partial [Staurois parvus]